MVNDALAQELIAMTDEDRRLQSRALGDDFAARLAYRRVTVRNGDRLADIIDEYGWPTADLVGQESSPPGVANSAARRLGKSALAGAAPAQCGVYCDVTTPSCLDSHG
jgi:hypothetical protein